MSTVSPSGAPSVQIEPGAHAPGGRVCVVRVHARNLASGPRRLTFTLLGLDGDWLPVPVQTGAVAADATVTVELQVPIAVGAVPGTYPFALAVEADVVPVAGAAGGNWAAAGGNWAAAGGNGAAGGGNGFVPAQRAGEAPRAATTMVEGELRVDAPSTVMLGVEPAESEGVLARNVHVVLSNSGDQPASLRLEARPEKGLRVSLDDERPRIPAHSTVRIPARVSMRPQIVGHRSRRTYTVSAHGDQAPARFQAVYTSRPMVGSGVIRLLAMAMVVVVWVTGVIITLPWLTDRLTGTEVVTAAGQAVGQDDEGGGAGTGSGGPGGSGDGTGGSGPDDGAGEGTDEEAVDEGVRIGGVVGGADPGGVQVRVAPASVLDRTGADADGSAGAAGGGSTGGSASSANTPGGAVIRTAALTRTTGDAGFGKIPAQALTLVRTETVAAERTTSTQDDGTWAFAGMSPNVNYLITLSKPGYQTQRYVMSGTEAAAAPLKVELVAGAGSMSGMITGPAGPVGGATVTLTDGTTTVTTSTSTTGDIGYWSVDGLSTPSTYLVTASGPGLGQQSALVDLGAGGTRSLDLRLLTGVASLAGTVTGPDSLGVVGGLGGITVTATDGTTTRTASTVTGARAGTFVLADLPVPATYTVTFSGDGYASQTHEVELVEGSSAALLDVLLDVSSGVVQGTVKDTAGVGLGGAGLTLTDGENTYKTMSTSDAEGSYRFNGIAPGEYVLTGETFGHVNAYAPVTVDRGGVATADLVLTPISGDGLVSTSRIRGRVSDARTNGQINCPGIDPGEVCEVTVSMTAQAMDGSTRNISVTVAPDLEYTIPAATEEGLLPGLYTLQVAAPGYESGEVKVQVPMGQTVVASQVALYPSPSIVGTILTRVGAVPAGTCVVAIRDGVDPATVGDCVLGGDPTDPTCTITGDARCAGVAVNGSYTLERLSSGTYQVSVIPGGDEYVTVPAVPVSLAPGDVRRYDATLDRLGRVFFTVLSDTGSSVFEPAAGAEVTPVWIDASGETPLQALTTDTEGRVLITALTPGTYRFDAVWEDTGASPVVELSAKSQVMTVGNNQELSNQVVLTRLRSAFTSRVVTHLGSTGAVGAGGVTVTLNGIVGYSGLVPIWQSASTQTDADGYFHVQPAAASPLPPNTIVLPLAVDQVNVEVSDARYLPHTRNGAGIVELAATPIEIQPRGQRFTGTLVLAGDTGTADPTEAEFRIDQAPPGALGAQLSALADGSLVWVDPSQPQDTSTAYPSDTLVRPGTYRITASLEGFDPVTVTLTVPVGSPAAALTVTLNKFGRLQVGIRAADAAGAMHPVLNPTVTLIRPLQGNVTTAAIPGTSTVDFGEMASGTYQVHVQAPGYTTEPQSVVLTPGNTAILPVTITKLGSISGKVTAGPVGNTRALPNVLVTAKRGSESFTAVTDATGFYRITGTATEPGLADGTWEVTADLHGYRMDFPVDMGGGLGQTHWDVVIDPAEDATRDIPMVAGLVDLTVDLYDPDKPAGNQAVSGMAVVLHGPGGSVNPTCTPSSPQSADCPAPTAGRYVFRGLDPGTYTLDAVGLGYAPLMVNVTVIPGENTHVNIPIATRTNTISGTVSGQAGASAAQLLEGATVTLRTDEANPTVIDTFTTPASGAFSFTGVADGAFVIEVAHADYTTGARSVYVQGGQSASVDIVLFTEARQVTVTVTSQQGFDLTGALVSLLPEEGQGALAAQPAVPAGGSTYTTTFTQVPPGDWTVSVSGPAGHYGTFTEDLAGGDDAVTVEVDEVRLRLVATAAASGAPSTLTATVHPADDLTGTPVTTQALGVNGGATVIYLPRAGGHRVTATKPSGWTSTPLTYDVDEDDTDVTATFVLTKDLVGTTTTLSAAPTSLVQGATVTLTATVAAVGADPDAGTVTFYRDGTSIGTAPVDEGEAVLAVATTGWTLGSRSLTATFGGTSEFSGSTSPAVNLTVTAPAANTTTTVTASPTSIVEGVGTAVVLEATVARSGPGAGPDSGTVTFETSSGTLGTGTVGSNGKASLTVNDTSGWEVGTVTVTATFGGVFGTFNGSSGTVTVTVTEPEP